MPINHFERYIFEISTFGSIRTCPKQCNKCLEKVYLLPPSGQNEKAQDRRAVYSLYFFVFNFPSPTGIVIAGFGSGHIRILSLATGLIIAEIAGHAGWITGMDLASASGLLITSAEDGYVRVRVYDLRFVNKIEQKC